jgi:hypothetical protein
MTKPKTSKPAAPPEVVDKSRHIQLQGVKGKTDDRLMTDAVAQGILANASTAIKFSAIEVGPLSLTDMVATLREEGQAVNRGDLSALERTLTAQALTLNTIFGELARIAQCNLFRTPETADRYLRLALKAQSQSRATVETLAGMKNPQVVFARQTNINNGGQQQVNNGALPQSAGAQAGASADPGETVSRPNELLEDLTHGSTQLDAGAAGAAGRTNQGMEALGAINRSAQP